MNSIRERILREVVARLSDAVAPVLVLRHPTIPITREASPALLLFAESDSITAHANHLVDRSLTLRLTVVTRGEDAFDQAGLQAEALALLDQTLAQFVGAREREGGNLAAVMGERIDGIERIVAQVRHWLPEIRVALRARLESKLADLKLPLEPGRLEQEVVLNLQKIDVDEELDRLTSHIREARRIFGLPEAVGRRLDFLMQEFNREANTLGSKSVDARTTNAAVELKVLIEQLREQVQNLE